jgi:hypothetical protein
MLAILPYMGFAREPPLGLGGLTHVAIVEQGL